MSNDLTTFACTISAVVAVFRMHIFKSILCASEFATRSVPARIQLCINATEICIIPLLALIFCSTICVLCKLTAGPNILLHDGRVVYDAISVALMAFDADHTAEYWGQHFFGGG